MVFNQNNILNNKLSLQQKNFLNLKIVYDLIFIKFINHRFICIKKYCSKFFFDSKLIRIIYINKILKLYKFIVYCKYFIFKSILTLRKSYFIKDVVFFS